MCHAMKGKPEGERRSVVIKFTMVWVTWMAGFESCLPLPIFHVLRQS